MEVKKGTRIYPILNRFRRVGCSIFINISPKSSYKYTEPPSYCRVKGREPRLGWPLGCHTCCQIFAIHLAFTSHVYLIVFLAIQDLQIGTEHGWSILYPNRTLLFHLCYIPTNTKPQSGLKYLENLFNNIWFYTYFRVFSLVLGQIISLGYYW